MKETSALIITVTLLLSSPAWSHPCAQIISRGGVPFCLNPMKTLTTINGEALPARPLPLQNSKVMLDTFGADGKRIFIERGTRKAGTRAAIHIHEFGGSTCLLSGEMTVFIEGKRPQKFLAGSCYYMPPNVPMSAANLGTSDVDLVDYFVLPSGVPTMTKLEPAY